jgi:hypothetical protein
MIEARTPDGATHQFPDGTPQEVVDRVVKAYVADNKQPAPEPTMGQAVGRGLGLGVRDVVEGASALPGMALDAVTWPGRALVRAAGGEATAPSDMITKGMDAAGLPQPETPGEQVRSAAVRGGAAALPFMGAGAALGMPAYLAPAGQIVRAPAAATMLTTSPAAQVAGGMGGGAAGEGARQAGYGPLGQAGAALAGGVAGAGLTAAAGAGLRAMRGAPVAPGAIAPPKTVDEAKAIAGGLYDKADEVGGTLTPAFTDKLIEAARKTAPQTKAGMAVAGETPITSLATRMAALKGQPISLRGAQEIDEALGGLIDDHFKPTGGLTKNGQALFNLQSEFRNMINEADPSHVTGGTSGFEALSQARKAWSQAMKMQDIERIQLRASVGENPSTMIRSGIRTLLSNPSRMRGYSEAEVTALKDAAKRGVLGSLLNTFGSKLIPVGAFISGTAGSGGNPVVGLASGLAANAEAGASRAGATYLQNRRLQGVMGTLGAGVPPPAGVNPPYVGAAVPQNALLPVASAAAAAQAAQRRNRLLGP